MYLNSLLEEFLIRNNVKSNDFYIILNKHIGFKHNLSARQCARLSSSDVIVSYTDLSNKPVYPVFLTLISMHLLKIRF